MRLPSQGSVTDYLDERKAELVRQVQAETGDYLLNVNESQYIDCLIEEHRVQRLVFDLEGVTASSRQEMVPASKHPSAHFDSMPGEPESFERLVIEYRIPYAGDRALLLRTPIAALLSSMGARVQVDCVCFDIIDWGLGSENVNPRSQKAREDVRRQADTMGRAVERYNRELEGYAKRVVRERKEELRRRLNVLAALDMDVRQREDLPRTFAIPVRRAPLVIQKPQAPVGPYEPDPTLDQDMYDAILKMLHDLGVEMERVPSTYEGKEEESLRDSFLLILELHFESATGETFNKSGKTDILIRHEGKNAFVAECKFWHGAKRHHDAIDQLLSYLTWRDSKAAILCFVKSKDIKPMLARVDEETRNHPCFVKDKGERLQGWHDYEFHLPNDPSRPVLLAILSFHFPE